MKKKILSLVMIVAMVLSMMAISPAVSAEADPTAVPTVKVTDAVGMKGDTVTVSLLVTAPSFNGGTFGISYDKTRLEYVSGSVKDLLGAQVPAQENNAAVFDNDLKETISVADFGVLLVLGNIEITTEVNDLAFLTLDFKVKDDAPSGDAFVTCVPGKTQIQVLPAGGGGWKTVNWVAGKVTVVSDQMSVPTPVPDGLQYTYDDAAGTATVSGYTGTAKDIVIPAVDPVKGYPVVAIGDSAFAGAELTGCVLPASVVRLGKKAFSGSAEEAKFVFLTTASEIAVAGYAAKTIPFDAEVLYFYGIPGSGVAALAANENLDYPYYDYVAPNQVVVNGESFNLDTSVTEIAAPGAAFTKGETFIGWDVNGTTYAPGENVPVSNGMTFTPVTVANPVTANGASIRLAEGTEIGLRFTADIKTDDYNKLVALYGAENVTLGMLITPKKYVLNTKEFTKDALDAYVVANGGVAGDGYVDIAVDGAYKVNAEAGTFTIAGSLKNFSATTLAKNPEFVAVGYMTVTTPGGSFIVYGDYDMYTGRTVTEVATALKANSGTLTTDQIAWLDELLSKFGLA